MKKDILLIIITFILVLSVFRLNAQTVVYPDDASMPEKQAAKEIRK